MKVQENKIRLWSSGHFYNQTNCPQKTNAKFQLKCNQKLKHLPLKIPIALLRPQRFKNSSIFTVFSLNSYHRGYFFSIIWYSIENVKRFSLFRFYFQSLSAFDSAICDVLSHFDSFDAVSALNVQMHPTSDEFCFILLISMPNYVCLHK